MVKQFDGHTLLWRLYNLTVYLPFSQLVFVLCSFPVAFATVRNDKALPGQVLLQLPLDVL